VSALSAIDGALSVRTTFNGLLWIGGTSTARTSRLIADFL
jgi:hypothetical protein